CGWGERWGGGPCTGRKGRSGRWAPARTLKQGAGAPTDEERVGLFKTMYAYCGTYRVDGSKLLTQPKVAWTPNWTKREHTASWKVYGKTLTIETLPFKSQLDGVDVVAIVEFEKE